MRNKLLFISIVALSLCFVMLGMARANVPDILFNNTGIITYDAATQILSLSADDLKIVYADGSEGTMWLSIPGQGKNLITHDIDILVDNTGKMIGEVNDGRVDDMVEKIVQEDIFEFAFMDLNGNVKGAAGDWNVGDIILQGDVTAFSVTNFIVGQKPEFTFVVDPYAGKFITENIFPDYPIKIVVQPDNALEAGESWEEGFTLIKAKGDKFPVPEPGTLLFLGIGLFGLLGVSRKKRG